uniref:DNA 5'-3' helicase n=1 Tax=Calliarthron tuberculosum TaxID=48942 RepID=M4IU41_CALTB|nr:replicative DNA helicase subunit [Calliarthron tuberculosum]AGA63798.1 replicative DNA helicase subunit [Calliarthron tuberculosum]
MLIKVNNYYNKYLPPHNIIAEEIIIGYILSDSITAPNVINNIQSCLFTLERHQIIYLNVTEVYNIYSQTDIPKLINKLWTKNLLNPVGGVKQIIELIQKAQSISNYYDENIYIQYFIEILYYHHIKRLFIQYSYCILELSYIKDIAIQQIYRKSIQYIHKIAKVLLLQKRNHFNNLINKFILKTYLDESKNKAVNILSGFKDLDQVTKGFKQGDLIIIAGRPSMGKTSFAINITNHLIRNLQLSVYIFSLEMSKTEILDKILAINSNIKVNNIQQKIIQIYEWKNLQVACQMLLQSQLSIDDEGNASIDYINHKYKIIKQKKRAIIVDYLQLIKFNNQSLKNRSLEIGYITRELKLLAKNSKSPMIVLSQLNRNIENRINKRPLLSDLRESGCISYLQLPNLHKKILQIQKDKIEAINFQKNSYKTKSVDFIGLQNKNQQYIYLILTNNNIQTYTTHNHNLFTDKKWKKEDQIKNNSFNNLIVNNNFNINQIIEFIRFSKIKLLSKTKVYDTKVKEYSNFITGKQIVHNSIEQDADLVLMLYKDTQDINNQILDIIIAKHRNGPIGSFQLLFHADTCKFSSIKQNFLQIHGVKLQENE